MGEETNSNYYQEWYSENGDDLNERRRRRYHEDPVYREKVLEWNRRARDRRRRKQAAEKRARRSAMKLVTNSAWKTVEIEIDGVRRRMFTIGALAKALGKGVSTIRVWERTGLLKETPYRSPKGDRLYSVEMVEEIRDRLARDGKLKYEEDAVRFRKRVNHVVKTIRYSDGEVARVQLFKVGSLAKAVNRTVVAVTQMEKRGVLPRTPLLASKLQYRLYTVEMIEAVQRSFDRRHGAVRGHEEWQAFYAEVEQEWRELRLWDAEVIDEGEGDA